MLSRRLFAAKKRDLFPRDRRHPDPLRREEAYGAGRQNSQTRRWRRDINRPTRPVRQEIPRICRENHRRIAPETSGQTRLCVSDRDGHF